MTSGVRWKLVFACAAAVCGTTAAHPGAPLGAAGARGGEAGGNGPPCVIAACDGVAENEPCDDTDVIDDVNGGCNSDPPVFGSVTLDGPSICGVNWAHNGGRDTDWFEFSVAETTDVRIILRAETDSAAFFVHFADGMGNCIGIAPVDGTFAYSHACHTMTQVGSATLAPGDYVLFVATAGPEGTRILTGFPCPAGGPMTSNAYEVSICTAGLCVLGACCLPDRTCTPELEPDCVALGGTHLGDGTSCAASSCVPGACCLPGGACAVEFQVACSAAGGTYLGDGSSCAAADCVPAACCLPGEVCVMELVRDCAALGGTHQGAGSSCAVLTCATGACCLTYDSCIETTEALCTGTFAGPATVCGSCTVENTTQGTVHPTIQQAIDAGVNGDEIVVGPGSYPERLDFLGKALTVRSSAGPALTIIEGGDAGLGPEPLLACVNGEGADTVIDGFTITGGNAVDGAGLLCLDSGPTVRRCVFTGNIASDDGGAIYIEGPDADPWIQDCMLLGNSAADNGGAVVSIGSSDPTFVNCVIAGNVANNGGAIFVSGSSTNDVNILACTLTGNTALNSGGGVFKFNAGLGNPTVGSSILYGNEPDEITGSIQITHSLVEGGAPGIGNLDGDPLFVARPDDLRLQPGSPCIDAGSNADVPLGVTTDLDGNDRILDGDGDGTATVDMGAYEHVPVPPCPEDLSNSGAVDFADLLILLGAWGPCAACPEDLNGNDVVDFADLLILLGAWGPC